MDVNGLLEKSFAGNTGQQWLIALVVSVLVFLALRLLQRILGNRVAKMVTRTETHWDDILIAALEKTNTLFVLVVAVVAGAIVPELSGRVRDVLRTTLIVAFLVQAGIWLSTAYVAWLQNYRARQLEEDAASVMTMNALGLVGRIVLWSILLLLILDNLGVDVTALVTGLGIGGIAVALAVQNILGDLLSSLSIAMDKPFVIGDFIVSGEQMGTVQNIGIKTTRVRSISGEQLVFPNGDLISSRIRNYGRMVERRVVFKLGVTYGTPVDKLRRVPDILREIVEAQEHTRFDRSHFAAYGDFSLDVETVYFVLSSDYTTYMDIQQSINLAIYDRFQAEGLEFAFPTRTIHVEPSGTADVVS